MAKAFGNTAKDASRIAIQAGKSFVTKDVTGTPKTSPLTVSSSVITIAIPTNAYQMQLYAISADVRISEESTAAANYFVLKATVNMTIDVANMDTLYLLRDAAVDATLYFLFKTI